MRKAVVIIYMTEITGDNIIQVKCSNQTFGRDR